MAKRRAAKKTAKKKPATRKTRDKAPPPGPIELAALRRRELLSELRAVLQAHDGTAEALWADEPDPRWRGFLAAYARSGSITAAAEAAGLSREAVYHRRGTVDGFAVRLNQANELAKMALFSEANEIAFARGHPEQGAMLRFLIKLHADAAAKGYTPSGVEEAAGVTDRPLLIEHFPGEDPFPLPGEGERHGDEAEDEDQEQDDPEDQHQPDPEPRADRVVSRNTVRRRRTRG